MISLSVVIPVYRSAEGLPLLIAELEKVLGEHELGLSGTVSPDTAAKVGQLTGAKVLVTGRVFTTDKDLLIVAKIIGTETSRVYGEMVEGPSAGSMVDLSAALASAPPPQGAPRNRIGFI